MQIKDHNRMWYDIITDLQGIAEIKRNGVIRSIREKDEGKVLPEKVVETGLWRKNKSLPGREREGKDIFSWKNMCKGMGKW